MDDFDIEWNAGMDVGNYQQQYDDAVFDYEWAQAVGVDNYASLYSAVTETAFDSQPSPWVSAMSQSFGSAEWSKGVNDYSATKAERLDSPVNDDSGNEGGLLNSAMSKLEGIGGWMEKNKKLSEVLAGGVAGAIGARERRKERESANQNNLEQIRLQDQMKQSADQRYSDSVKGLNVPTGMLYSGTLKRRGGQRVFDDQGKVVG
jgi:hypothetical protein